MIKEQSRTERAVKAERMRRRLASRIVGLRQKKGMNQDTLSERLGVQRARLANWESARHAPPVEDLVALADVLEVSVDALLTGRDLLEEADARRARAVAGLAEILEQLR